MSADEPSFKLVGLSVWIDGYKSPDALDDNGARARVECVSHHSVVRLFEPIWLDDLEQWARACQQLLDGKVPRASLELPEPSLHVTIDRSGEYNGFVAFIKITDGLTQSHEYRFDIDQSYVTVLIESINAVLRKFPVRGKRSRRWW
jgi:hypothetical protein